MAAQQKHPELFPCELSAGFRFHDSYVSKKQSLRLRRIKVKSSGEVFTFEKFTWLQGEEVYGPVTVGGQCVLGVWLVTAADGEQLKTGYGEFAQEAWRVPDHSRTAENGWHHDNRECPVDDT